MADFSTRIDRTSSDSTKWNKYRDRDVIPFWVADMDFTAPDFVLEALHERIDHGVLGYAEAQPALVDAACAWFWQRFNWKVDPDWLIWIPGVVPGLNIASRAIGSEDDALIIMTPVYPPFLSVPENSNKQMLSSPLIYDGKKWSIDFADIEDKARLASGLLLSNPQNPTGRVYSENELSKLAEICIANDVIVVSDEIHWGIVLDENRSHIPIASISEEISLTTITLIASTKTYNVAGLNCALGVIPDPSLRERFVDATTGFVSHISPLAYTAALATFLDRSSWIKDLVAYLRVNRDLLERCVDETPGIAMAHVEGTYLGWIDARSLQVDDPATFFENHGLGFSNGFDFNGEGFVRFNFACHRDLLLEGIERLKRAVSSCNLGS
ncbi:MAG TPA: aspartate aminotransferase [Gammaproteobacteria bacterium]|uniref:cysteine-S-conjugate beta-lyase n=1 Tax=marine metagenome TaxID=408172 RepID=A0A381PHD4_9ZZZZ|nr:aspartate aminotransferase [Gammaproteobacteria bacterium]|tara:strand:- start:236 stop:1384 length:1149 start_codon:yes stop_codon:yes gene_type:complete